MRTSVLSIQLAAALACSVLISSVQAQAIFRDNEINEENLIDALTPPPAEIRTRSIRVERTGPGVPDPSTVPAVAASASVLITFVTNSAELTPDARNKLDIVARALQADRLSNFRFSVEGHADPRGDPGNNLRLSQARAESVVDYLAVYHGVDRQRLRAIGRGDQQLANPSWAAAPENRRVTIVTLQE